MNPKPWSKAQVQRCTTQQIPATGATHRDRNKGSSTSASMDTSSSKTTRNETDVRDVPTSVEMSVIEPELQDEKLILYLELVTVDKNELYSGMPSWEEAVSVFFSVTKPDIQTGLYIRRLVRYAQCSRSAFIIGLVYLKRLEANDNKLILSPYNMHRLLITSLMLAAKIVDDRCYSNAHYARVGGIATVKEMNRLELQMLALLKYDLFVSPEEHDHFVKCLEENHRLPKSPSVVTRIHEYYPKQAQRALLAGIQGAAHLNARNSANNHDANNYDQEDSPGTSNGATSAYRFGTPGSQLQILAPPSDSYNNNMFLP